MRALTEHQLRETLVNASAEERQRLALPADFLFVDWDHLDFYAWRDPRTKGRGYVVAEVGGTATGIVLRASDSSSHARAAMCNLCHTMQPGDQVTMFTARKAGDAGERGDSVGTIVCADLSCHENVRLAAPLAPNEYRASVDRRIDGTRHRIEAFVERVWEP
ncbi:FBP domain-containing protein [Microbacterium sp. W1N]|uniref:FBP domain-containing protein n=1 Tax=Microbacterium festucae TaxID=2977531 RepID=UPI0021BFDF46|nr:FBP domain-containing protein [Microbacterium festucae]MCT9820816.1 FBP domain-containing protein [Microbacterium festucae]